MVDCLGRLSEGTVPRVTKLDVVEHILSTKRLDIAGDEKEARRLLTVDFFCRLCIGDDIHE